MLCIWFLGNILWWNLPRLQARSGSGGTLAARAINSAVWIFASSSNGIAGIDHTMPNNERRESWRTASPSFDVPKYMTSVLNWILWRLAYATCLNCDFWAFPIQPESTSSFWDDGRGPSFRASLIPRIPMHPMERNGMDVLALETATRLGN